MDSPFDVLAKTIALADGMPRREAVRRVGGALAAVALSSLGVGCSGGGGGGSSPMSPLPPGTSSTGRTPQGGGNSDCAHFCQQAFPPGPQRGHCVSDGAHGTGLCVQCAGDVNRLCTSAVGAYFCADLTSDVHNCGKCGNTCATSQLCVNGACCGQPGSRCASASQCCQPGICAGGTCCGAPGYPCTSDTQCCQPGFCINGACV
jgi:hypothetical protein